MSFTIKQWYNRFGKGTGLDAPNVGAQTPIDAAGLRDLEARLSAYAELHKVEAVVFRGSNNQAVNDRPALLAAITEAIANSLPLYIAPGRHRIDGPVHWPDQLVKIFGAGGLASILDFKTMTDGQVALKVGPDSAGGPGVGPGDWPQGYVRDFSIWVNGAPDSIGDGGAIGLQLSQTHPDVERVEVRGCNVGFDLVGNCYGTRFASCWAKYGWNNYGLLLREGDQSGQDITFENCWFSGRKGGVMIAGWGAGYHFRGGQISGGTALGSAQDWRGAVLMGPLWESADPNLGASGVNRDCTFTGVNFEGTSDMWQVRTFQPQRAILFQACHFMGSGTNGDTHAPLGIFKGDDFYDGAIKFDHCSYHRYYRGVKPDASADGPLLAYFYGAIAGAPNFPLLVEEAPVIQGLRVNDPNNDVAGNGRGFFALSNTPHSGVGRNGEWQAGALRLRGNGDGTLSKSVDYGVNWTAL